MKTLTKYLNEKLIINKDYHYDVIVPKSFNELRNIIEDRYDKFGAGTKRKPINFNDIDVSNINSFCKSNGDGIFQQTDFKYIDISDWDVSDVEDMRNMFYKCVHLQSVGDLYDWNVSSVKYMNHMFYYCKQLKSVGDLSNWDVSNVEDTACMFYNCKQLTSVGDLSNWNILHVKYMSSMFYKSGITNIPKWYK